MSPTSSLFVYAIATCVAAFTQGCGEVRPAAPPLSAPLDAGVSYPSSAAYDAHAGALLVGSYADGSIKRVPTSEETRRPDLPALPHDGREHVLRIRIDTFRQRIWVLASDGLYLYDSTSSQLTRRIPIGALSQHSNEHCLPDMALTRSGSVFVSSAMQTSLLHVDAQSLEVTLHEVQVDSDQGKDFGFSALTFAGDDDRLYAASATTGALWRVDPVAKRAKKIPLSYPIWGACALHAAPPGTRGSESRTDQVLYVAGGFRDSVQRVEVSATDLPSRVTTVQMKRPLIVPTGFALVEHKLLIVNSRLSQLPDFNGDGKSNHPFTIVPIPTP